MFFKGPKAIPVYRVGLEDLRSVHARAVALGDSFSNHFFFRRTFALLREKLKCPVDGWAGLLRLCKITLPVSEMREWGNSCTYPYPLSSKETTSELLWGDSFCFGISRVSFRNCLAEIHRKFANPEKFVIDSKDPFEIAPDFLELFSSAVAVLNALVHSGLTC